MKIKELIKKIKFIIDINVQEFKKAYNEGMEEDDEQVGTADNKK